MPSIAWFPLAILLFQLSEQAIFFVVVLGAAPSIANGVIPGVDYVPPLLLRAGRNLGARGLNLYRYVIAPAALPAIVAGLKQGWAFAWRSLMAGELLVVASPHDVDRRAAHLRPRTVGRAPGDRHDDRHPGARPRRRPAVRRRPTGRSAGAGVCWTRLGSDAGLGAQRLRAARDARRRRTRPAGSRAAALARGAADAAGFLQGILGDLRRAGLLHSQRGGEGGYALTRPAAEITVGDVVRAVNGSLTTVRGLPAETRGYPAAAAGLREVWLAVHERIADDRRPDHAGRPAQAGTGTAPSRASRNSTRGHRNALRPAGQDELVDAEGGVLPDPFRDLARSCPPARCRRPRGPGRRRPRGSARSPGRSRVRCGGWPSGAGRPSPSGRTGPARPRSARASSRPAAGRPRAHASSAVSRAMTCSRMPNRRVRPCSAAAARIRSIRSAIAAGGSPHIR